MSNHSFDADIATEYHSVEVAIMVWHFQYWIRKNKALGTNFKEGRTWTYQTYNDILGNFPYWSYDQVKRLLKKCFDLGIILKGNFNADKDDKTMWYAFADEDKFGISKVEKREDLKGDSSGNGRNRPIDPAKSPDRCGENAGSYKDRDTLPYTKKRCSSSPPKRRPPPSPIVFDEESRKFKGITEADQKAWREKFSALDIEKEIALCEEWALGNHRQNYRRSILTWFTHASKNQQQTADTSKTDKNLAEKIHDLFKSNQRNDFHLGPNYVEFVSGGQSPSTVVKFGDKNFVNICIHEIKKRNLHIRI